MSASVHDTSSVETRASWVVAIVALIILAVAYGAPLITAIALKPIAADLGTQRSEPALASSLTYLGAGSGGILMGYLTERIGIRWIVMFGAVMIACGTALSASGGDETRLGMKSEPMRPARINRTRGTSQRIFFIRGLRGSC